MIRVLVVDDQPAIRRGLRMRLGLEDDLIVVGEAPDGPAALALAPALRPDVILLDVQMPGMDGIDTAEALRALAPACAVVLLTLHGDPITRARAEAAGVVVFVEKHEADMALVQAIHRAAGAPRA
ncbi:MAG TPA: response regulator transcription factor [Chloroflexia bacterium]